MEKELKPMSGYLALILAIVSIIGAAGCFISGASMRMPGLMFLAPLLLIAAVFLFKGIMVVNPNDARVCTFFGKYVGSVKDNGLLWVNPFYSTSSIILRSQN